MFHGRDDRRGSDVHVLPYIAILAGLGPPSESEVTFTKNDIDGRYLCIYVAAIDAITYSTYPRLEHTRKACATPTGT